VRERSDRGRDERRKPPGKQRRALTQQRRPQSIELSGHPRLAKMLSRALDVGGGEDQARKLTHGFHSYPARMHPLTARRALALLELPAGAIVLDPFCGSGTVMVEAVRGGFQGVGVDANPLALLVAKAKTWLVYPARRKEMVNVARRIGALVIEEGKAARRSGYEAPPPRKPPPGMSVPERTELLHGWFAPHVRREVELLGGFIDAEKDEELRDVLRAVFSSVLVKVSRRTSDTSGEFKEDRPLARGMAARLFADRAEELAMGLQALGEEAEKDARPPTLHHGDARRLPLPPGSVAAIVTSPPYAGTYDYLDHHQLRMVMLGLDPRPLKANEIGARRSFGLKDQANVDAGLSRWERDYELALSEMARVLPAGGRALLVVGDSLAGRGKVAQAVFADDWLVELAPRVGLDIVAAASAGRDWLGAMEERAFAGRKKREHLVMLVKK
jgi:SAM-dependent methyltransferase